MLHLLFRRTIPAGLIISFLLISVPVCAGEIVNTGDLSQAVQKIEGQLGAMLVAMGEPSVTSPNMVVSEVHELALYLRTHSILVLVDQLAEEWTGERIMLPPAIPDEWPRERETLALLKLVQERLKVIAGRLPGNYGEVHYKRASSVDLTTYHDRDVLYAALDIISYQVHALLLRTIPPERVYQRVTDSVQVMARLLEIARVDMRIPDEPELELEIRSEDVLNRLLACAAKVDQLGSAAGVPMLVVTRTGSREAIPADCYDLSVLLQGELTFLLDHLADGVRLIDSWTVDRKIPAQVHQRSGLLERQIDLLLERIGEDRSWMRAR